MAAAHSFVNWLDPWRLIILFNRKTSQAFRGRETLKGIIESLDLRRPIYRKTAAYGHFGRENEGFGWERTDKAEVLRSDVGLSRSDVATAHH